MRKVAIVVLAASDTPEGRGRMVHALYSAKEFRDAGDAVKLIFDGIGVTWLKAFAKREDQFTQHYGETFDAVKDTIMGACNFCASVRFDINDTIQSEGYTLLGPDGGHHSFRDLIADGYQIITL